MKWLIAIFVVIGLGYGGYELSVYWSTFNEKKDLPSATAPVDVSAGSQLAGLPPSMEGTLGAAESQGGKSLGQWLAKNHAKVNDPRLAWIQLDYVVLVAPSDLSEARKVFKQVKERTGPTSPVYPRLEQLAKTYE